MRVPVMRYGWDAGRRKSGRSRQPVTFLVAFMSVAVGVAGNKKGRRLRLPTTNLYARTGLAARSRA